MVKNKEWSALSLKDRADFYKIAVDNGYTDKKDIINLYNSFKDGGNRNSSKGYVTTQKEDLKDLETFNSNWYKYRDKQLSSVIDQYNRQYYTKDLKWYQHLFPNEKTDAIGARNYINDKLNNVKEFTMSEALKDINTRKWLQDYYYQILPEERPDTNLIGPPKPVSDYDLGFLAYINAGMANNRLNTIVYADDSNNDSTKIHERAHISIPFIKGWSRHPVLSPISNVKLQNTTEPDSYFDSISEIYARLMQLRYDNNLDPSHTYTKEEINAMRNDPDFKDYHIFDRYTDESILMLLNEVAQNTTDPNRLDYVNPENIAAFGGRILDGTSEKNQTLSNEPVYYDDTYIEPAVVKAFNSNEDYNKYYGEQFGKQVAKERDVFASKIKEGLEFVPFLGDSMDVANVTGAIANKDYIQAGLLTGLMFVPEIVEAGGKWAFKKAAKGIQKLRKGNKANALLPHTNSAEDIIGNNINNPNRDARVEPFDWEAIEELWGDGTIEPSIANNSSIVTNPNLGDETIQAWQNTYSTLARENNNLLDNMAEVQPGTYNTPAPSRIQERTDVNTDAIRHQLNDMGIFDEDTIQETIEEHLLNPSGSTVTRNSPSVTTSMGEVFTRSELEDYLRTNNVTQQEANEVLEVFDTIARGEGDAFDRAWFEGNRNVVGLERNRLGYQPGFIEGPDGSYISPDEARNVLQNLGYRDEAIERSIALGTIRYKQGPTIKELSRKKLEDIVNNLDPQQVTEHYAQELTRRKHLQKELGTARGKYKEVLKEPEEGNLDFFELLAERLKIESGLDIDFNDLSEDNYVKIKDYLRTQDLSAGDIEHMSWFQIMEAIRKDAQGNPLMVDFDGTIKPMEFGGRPSVDFKGQRAAAADITELYENLPRGYSIDETNTSVDSERIKLNRVTKNYGTGAGQTTVELVPPDYLNQRGNNAQHDRVYLRDLLKYEDQLPDNEKELLHKLLNKEYGNSVTMSDLQGTKLLSIIEEEYNKLAESLEKALTLQWEKIKSLDSRPEIQGVKMPKKKEMSNTDLSMLLDPTVSDGSMSPIIYRQPVKIVKHKHGGPLFTNKNKYLTGGGIINSYIDPSTVGGAVAKGVVQLFDPTGISSYPDVYAAGKEFFQDPTLANAGRLAFETVGALPLIGKVTAPFKAAKTAKIASRVADLHKLGKIADGATNVNKVIDTLPELIPLTRKWAEATQDFTTKYIVDPIFDVWASKNKYSRVLDFKRANAFVPIVNAANNVADVSSTVESAIKTKNN